MASVMSPVEIGSPFTPYGLWAAPCQLHEIAGAPGRVDRDNGVIRGVKVLGFQSQSTGRTIGLEPAQFGEAVNQPYCYSRHAMMEAAPMYEGATVYVDHPEFSYRPDGERIASPRDRKTGEVFGKLVNIRVTESGMYADLEYLKEHPLTPKVLEVAERMPEKLALSHNATGHPRLMNGRIVIDKITDVRSVDLVGEKPGTTHGLFESAPPTNPKGNIVAALLEATNDVLDPAMPKIGDQTTDFEHLVNPEHQPGTGAIPGTARSAGVTGKLSLTEDDAPPPPDGGDAMPAATPEGGGDHFDNAFKTELDNIWDGPGDDKEKAQKLVKLLKLKGLIGELRGASTSETTSEGDYDKDQEGPVGADMEESAGVLSTAESAPPVAAPAATAPVVETTPAAPAKPVIAKGTSRREIARELLETIVQPSVDLLNAAGQPITGKMLLAVCLMPASQRRAFVGGLPKHPVIAPRSQAGAVGVHETTTRAAARPQQTPTNRTPAKKLSETDPVTLLQYVRGARVSLMG